MSMRESLSYIVKIQSSNYGKQHYTTKCFSKQHNN